MVQQTDIAAAGPRRWTLHFVLGVAWLTYWMGNLYIGLYYTLPFLDYYVVTALLLIYVGFVRPLSLIQAISKPMMWAWGLTAAIPLIMYIDAPYGSYSWVDLKTRIVYLSAVGGTTLILLDEDRKRLLRTAARVTLIFSVALNFVDVVLPLPFERSATRAAGLWGDPNISAAAMGSLLLLSVHPLRPTRRGLFLVGVTMLAILTTFSRSGILFGVFLTLVYLFAPRGDGGPQLGNRMGLAFFTAVVLAVGSIIAIQVLNIDMTMLWRIQSAFTLDTSDASAQSRLARASFGIERALDFFWTGRGLGASTYYGLYSHNSYIAILYNYGIIGLIFYTLVISQGAFQMIRYGWKRAAVPGLLSANLIYYGIFAHTVPDTPGLSIALVAFMFGMLIDPPEEQLVPNTTTESPPDAPGLLQPERAQ